MTALHPLRRQGLQLQAKLLSTRAAFDPKGFPAHYAADTADLSAAELAYLLSWLTPVATDLLGGAA